MSVRITKFNKYEHGHLLGFADIEIAAWGVYIRGCKVFRKGENEWVTLPSREYEDNGETKYQSLVGFKEKGVYDRFKKALDKAWMDFKATASVPPPPIEPPPANPAAYAPPPPPQNPDEGLPF